MPRRLLAVVLVAAAVLTAGCRLDVDVRVAMAPDGSGAVTVTVKPDDELLAEQPAVWNELRLDDALAAGWQVTGPEPDDVLVLTKPFRTPEEGTRVLAELNGADGPFRDLVLTRTTSFARVASGLTGEVRVDGGLAAFADAELVAALGGVPLADVVTVPLDEGLRLTLTAELPGTLVATAGPATTVTATTASSSTPVVAVAWTPSLSDGVSTTVGATAVLTDQDALDARRWSRTAWWMLGAYVVVMVIGAAVLVWRRRRPSRTLDASPAHRGSNVQRS